MTGEGNDVSDCPPLVSPYKTPKIIWYQNDLAVFIRIILTDVERYRIQVKDNNFKFSTVVNDNKYFAGFKLCGAVVAEKTTHESLGREVKICLIKAHKWTDWPRLHLNNEKNQFISYDPEHIVKKKWDDPFVRIEDRESFEDYKKRMNITNIMPADDSSTDSDSDDERIIGYDQL